MTAERAISLRDGSIVAVRPITPSDREGLASSFSRLSEQSRYRRFFSSVSELKPRQLDYLTDVDHHDHEALVAVTEADGIVAVARFVRTSPSDVAEPAIVVGDDWQGRGLATQLLDLLADRAREEGIHTFVAPVLSENRGAIKLFEGLGDATVQYAGREIELTIPLGVEAGATPSLRRLLQDVAAGTVRPALAFWQRVAAYGVPRRGERANVVVVGMPGGEDAAARVAEAAACVAGDLGAEVHVVAAQRFLLDEVDEVGRRVQAFAARFSPTPAETHIHRGDLAAALIDEASSRAARLIVVDGTETHSGAPLRGSTWDHVSHHAPCDVLIVR